MFVYEDFQDVCDEGFLIGGGLRRKRRKRRMSLINYVGGIMRGMLQRVGW